ncbi:MAG: T9SS type A sorting domain-containing protein [Bacteroidales bacterium]|nr:T9SS type A sorting domain-containing protein [Bacteroidales bacterium]MCF8352158.1 T9SS type A sorting domain-containing protein [Bacteroidales bacterium]MCF8377454.1 T9SS type A sorting domain-containing protein [Bacteroidales bacterium]MCF8401549.1 T9SS type A sorting domain-containing protein [Bacteroidales bacterium]
MMSKNTLVLMMGMIVVFPFEIAAQEAVIIDHQSIELNQIPMEWIDSAKANLYIGYGHTSHGSQLTSGMDAIELFYPDGTYDWSHSGGAGELHLFEGAGYGSGYLELDCGYPGWDDQTRTYLNDHPACNAIIWSWCGQVNNVNLQEHYLQPMTQLEEGYPDVQFVYMTGHLEGLGPGGSLFEANQQIRDFCLQNDKILFDFADIEKYSPDADTNYQDYFADDGCNYQLPGGGQANWAHNWLSNNPGHELNQMSSLCGSCAHSVSLNCVKKGIACWHLWARLAGWNGQVNAIEEMPDEYDSLTIYPQPACDVVTIELNRNPVSGTLLLFDLHGKEIFRDKISSNKYVLNLKKLNCEKGLYVLRLIRSDLVLSKKMLIVPH